MIFYEEEPEYLDPRTGSILQFGSPRFPKPSNVAGNFLDNAKKGVDQLFGLPGRVATGFNKDVPKGFSEQVGKATVALLSPNVSTLRPDGLEKVDPLVEAIAHLESRGVPEDERYAFSKPSGDPKLGQDMGKYQVTEGELKTYGKRYLGRTVESGEFLANPALQDEYVRRKVEYLRGQGISDAEILRRHRGGQSVKKGAHQGYVDAGLRFLRESNN